MSQRHSSSVAYMSPPGVSSSSTTASAPRATASPMRRWTLVRSTASNSPCTGTIATSDACRHAGTAVGTAAGSSAAGGCTAIAATAAAAAATHPVHRAKRAKLEAPVLSDVVDSARRNGYDETVVRAFVSAPDEVWMLERTEGGERIFVGRTEYRDAFGADPPVTRGGGAPARASVEGDAPSSRSSATVRCASPNAAASCACTTSSSSAPSTCATTAQPAAS
ncbi:MAG: hypothetical protein ACKOFI_09725, partial [Phycisphaerales bacterium]